MKRVIYLSLLLLVACSDSDKAEVAKETDLMMNEITTISRNKTEQKKAKFWQDAYLKLDIALEKYKKADPETVEFTREVRNVFESVYDLFDKYEVSSRNAANFLSYAVNTITGNGTTILDVMTDVNARSKQITERVNKLGFREEQLEVKLCAKYQIRCKANSPAAPEKK